ncbi:MAG TPA: efflux RND transporter periplasmic adaptor subunit [Balneolaceae bacterium]|nr:efflux RND transporter periplasmic adaptor subunit [Balneolaceae bacterium]
MTSLTESKEKKQSQQDDNASSDKTRIQQLASQLSRDHSEGARKRKIKRWIYVILIIGLIVAGYFTWQAFRPTAVVTSVISYQRVGVAAQPLLRVSGYVTYPRISTISARVQTPVDQLNFTTGEHVKKGQILAIFDHQELLSRRNAQRITINDLKETLQRTRQLYKGGAASEADLQNVQTQLATAQANLAVLNTQIDNSIVRAPFSGLIINKMVEVGEVASRGVCQLADDSNILVSVDINQTDISKITPQTSAVVTLDAYPNTEYAAKIYEIMPTADEAKNTIPVKLKLLHPDNRFKPNMSAKVFFTDQNVTQNARLKAVLTVDKSALIKQNGVNFLYIVRNGKARKRKVQLGRPVDERLITIKSGVKPNQRAILDPQQYHLKNGDWVKIK